MNSNNYNFFFFFYKEKNYDKINIKLSYGYLCLLFTSNLLLIIFHTENIKFVVNS